MGKFHTKRRPRVLSSEEFMALQAYATARGRYWKSDLLAIWERGVPAWVPHHHYLRVIRNDLGPSWLKKFRLPQ